MAPPKQPLPPTKARPTAAPPRKTPRAPPAAQAKITTALSAYPRTDPVGALAALLRLLAALPARVGGCQWKLTPAEHALAVHLVGVLDPYVYRGVRALAPGNSAARVGVGLVDLPTEVLDAVLFHVEGRRDLLSVGLACRRVHDVVFPRHFEYRVVRAKVSTLSVWHHLAVQRSLARNVRRVEILDERAASSGVLVPRGILQCDTDLESTDDELRMHAKQERFLATALTRMTALREFKWACNHSPISIANVWPTLMMRAGNLKSINICDNLVFSPRVEQEEHEESDEAESESDADGGRRNDKQGRMERVPAIPLPDMESVTFRSTPHVYGSSKNPDMGRVAAMLHQCMNLKDLEVTYIAPRTPTGTAAAGAGNSTRPRPLADEFLTYGRWAHLTTLALVNLRCASYAAAAGFLGAHPALEVLHIELSVHSAAGANNGDGHGGGLVLASGALPRLRDIRASKAVIAAILTCPLTDPEDSPSPPHLRPLESVRGFKLAGTAAGPSPRAGPADAAFLALLKSHTTVKRAEMAGWREVEDVRRLVGAVPGVVHLDVGRRLGPAGQRSGAERERGGGGEKPVGNIIEWTELLATLPALVTLHGVKFFYEVAAPPTSTLPFNTTTTASWSGALSSSSTSGAAAPALAIPATSTKQGSATMSMMERSRMRKNDETAGVLAWKCPRLRRVDHWEEGGGRVVVLLREHGEGAVAGAAGGGVRWEVRRVR